MPFYSLTIKNRERPLKNILAQYIIILLGAYILARITCHSLWAGYTVLCHTVLELACVFIAISSFLTVWHNYHHNPPVNHLIGFGLLAAGIFSFFHIFHFPGHNLFPAGYTDLSARYWVLGRFTEAAVLLICAMNLFHRKINKWAGMLFTAGLTLSVSCLVLSFPGLMPVLVTGQGLTPAKIALEHVIVAMYLASLYQLRNRVNSRDILTYRYIFMALLIAVPAELCFTILHSTTSFYTNLGHILKITCCYYLYRGIFVSAVTYPYEKLEEAKRYTAGILNGLPIGLITYDNNLRMSFVNRKALELTGMKNEEEVIGLHADDLVARYCGLEEIGDTIAMELGKTSHPVKNRIMTIKNAGLKIEIDARSLEGGGALVLFTEATKEQELENLQLQTRTVLNSLSNIVVVLGKGNRIIMCNQAFETAFEMKSGEVLGKTLQDLLSRFELKNRDFIPKATPGAGLCEPGEVTLTTPGGNKKQLVLQCAPIYNLDGRAIGGIFVASDVTALKREQELLQQREKLAMLGEMAAGVVHEIKNPLTTIKGFSHIIASMAQDETTGNFARIIERSANDMNKVVSDFLAFARPRPPALKETSVNEMLQSIRFILETHILTNGIDLDIALSAGEKTVMADESQIKQVLLNIISNSVEAMAGAVNPRLTISSGLSWTKDEMFIAISDNGKGMTPDERLKAGTPFFTTKDKGTGLGLSICYQIVNEHGGRVCIESQEGIGTRFTITLPCKETPDQRTAGKIPDVYTYPGDLPLRAAALRDKNPA